MVTCLFFAWGFITSNTDPLIAAMRGIYTLNVAEGMLTQFAFFLAYFVVSLPAAALLARLGHSRTIITALMVMIGACGLMLVASHLEAYTMVLVALFVMAGGITVLQVAANPLAASLGAPERQPFPADLRRRRSTRWAWCWASASDRSSMLPRRSVRRGRAYPAARPAQHGAWRDRPCLCADRHRGRRRSPLLIFVFRHRINTSAADITDRGRIRRSRRSRSGWAVFGAVAIFLYVGAEVTIAQRDDQLPQPRRRGWVSTLEAAGGVLASYYWRRGAGRAVRRQRAADPGPGELAGWPRAGDGRRMPERCGVHAALRPAAAYAALGVGFFNSIMFPTIFSITMERSKVSNASVSGLLCMAIVGGALLPLFSGWIADGTSIGMTFVLPAIAYVGIASFAGARSQVAAGRREAW